MTTLNLKYQPVNSFHFFFWLFSVVIWNFVLNPNITPVFYQINSIDSNFLISVVLFGYTLPLIIGILRLFRLVNKRVFYFGILLLILTIIATLYVAISISSFTSEGDDNWLNQLTWDNFFKSGKDFLEVIGDFFIHKILYVIIFHLSIVAAVYLNLKYFIPKILNFRKFLLYSALVICLTICSATINFVLFNNILDPIFPLMYFISYYNIWELIFIIFNYLAFTTFVYLAWQYAHNLIDSQRKTQNELSALKAQINPHFLFNNLNTIYSMAERNDKRTGDVVLKLSDFLRYVLYDTTSDKIPLEKEIEIIKTYIDLQKERVNPTQIPIEFNMEGDMQNAMISPLLLLPLAENCFKHGIGKNPGKIIISVKFSERQLTFTTENNVFKSENYKSNEKGGIGLPNVQQRLNLLYPGHHILSYGESNSVFRLRLTLDIDFKT